MNIFFEKNNINLFKHIKQPCFYNFPKNKKIKDIISNHRNNIVKNKNVNDFIYLDISDVNFENPNLQSKKIIFKIDKFIINQNISINIQNVRDFFNKLLLQKYQIAIFIDNPLLLEYFYDISVFIVIDANNNNKLLLNLISSKVLPYKVIYSGNNISQDEKQLKINYVINKIKTPKSTLVINCDNKICYAETTGNQLSL